MTGAGFLAPRTDTEPSAGFDSLCIVSQTLIK